MENIYGDLQIRMTGSKLFVSHAARWGAVGTPSLLATLDFLQRLHLYGESGNGIPDNNLSVTRLESIMAATEPAGLALTATLLSEAGELVSRVCTSDTYRAFLTADATELPLILSPEEIAARLNGHDLTTYGAETLRSSYARGIVANHGFLPKLNFVTLIAPYIGTRLDFRNMFLRLLPPEGADYGLVDHVKRGVRGVRIVNKLVGKMLQSSPKFPHADSGTRLYMRPEMMIQASLEDIAQQNMALNPTQ